MPSPAHIPTYIPFDQAVQHYGLPKKVLTQEIRAGKIQAGSRISRLLVNQNGGLRRKTG